MCLSLLDLAIQLPKTHNIGIMERIKREPCILYSQWYYILYYIYIDLAYMYIQRMYTWRLHNMYTRPI